MNKLALKIAVSPLVIGLTMVGCATGQNSMFQPAATTAKAARENQQASDYYGLAQQSLQLGDTPAALVHAEKAVELSPRDAGYRMLLADLYLKSGRFASAETSFSDVLELDPGNSRATFYLVLAEIALGKQATALVKLDRLSETAAAGDVGLAYALAGYPDRAVTILETAARAPDANGRVRQNLALAYALSGDWQRARVTASQDLSPADLAGRMEQWATFAQPTAQWDQVASLLGVAPAEDSGQPVRLALAPVASQAAYAQAEVPAIPEPLAEQPVQYTPIVASVPVEAPVEGPVRQAKFAEAVQSLVEPNAEVTLASLPAPTFEPAPMKMVKQERRSGAGHFVVQLASYDSASDLEEGWSKLQKRYGLGSAAPVTTTITLPGKGRFHRLSVAGFDTRAEASRTCASIKAKGGACFVRGVSGDAPVQWASRRSGRG